MVWRLTPAFMTVFCNRLTAAAIAWRWRSRVYRISGAGSRRRRARAAGRDSIETGFYAELEERRRHEAQPGVWHGPLFWRHGASRDLTEETFSGTSLCETCCRLVACWRLDGNSASCAARRQAKELQRRSTGFRLTIQPP